VIGAAEVAHVVDAVVAHCNPDRVYVFGSYAKGLSHEESDLDLIVVKASKLPRFRRGRDLNGILATMALSVDVLFLTPEEMRMELADPYSMLSAVMPSAKTLYPRS
jgi:predicted nucleotidyltransferase